MSLLTIDECFYQIRNGANIKQGNVDGGYPITRIETISNDVFNRDRMGYAGIYDLSKYTSYILEDGDLLMSHINSVQYLGRTVLYQKQQNEQIIHGMNLLGLKANKDIINPAYARYSFRSASFKQAISKITKKSVNQASFSINDLKRIKIEVPSLSEQLEIIDVLDKTTRIITVRKEQLKELDNLIKSRFIEMFGDPIRNNKGWDVAKLNDLTDVRDGTHDSPKYVDEGYPFITSKNITNGSIDFTTAQYITEKDYLHFEDRSHVDNGDILMPMIGTIGGAVIVNKDRDFAIKNVALIKFNKNKGANSIFVQSILNSREMQDYFESLKTGGTQKFIGLGIIRNLPIINPPNNLQNEFVSFVKKTDKSKFVIQQSLNETQKLFDSLMQEYFE